ncbi:hypothetical protein [Hoylesella nanceiensis]|uniref:hypothetical protein n=1 Tax=Hoylesella nanceiensis TaxID=425941 RepID=UPI0028E3B968|nr:hypothetical protein [Hoylesella nanceiensis]
MNKNQKHVKEAYIKPLCYAFDLCYAGYLMAASPNVNASTNVNVIDATDDDSDTEIEG